MDIDNHHPKYQVIEAYLEFLFREQQGFVQYATRSPTGHWAQDFFPWPASKGEIGAYVFNNFYRDQVYICPSLFKERKGKKEHVLGAHCVWADFDGNSPETFPLTPSLVVQTSIPGHTHVYWGLDDFYDPEEVTAINKSIAYELEADVSGWDSTQMLRPPETFHHAKQEPVLILQANYDIIYSPEDFVLIPEAPAPEKLSDLQPEMPNIEKVPAAAITIWENGPRNGDRSTALMNLAYIMAEKGLDPNENLAVVMDADKRWGKFSTRVDGQSLLEDLIAVAYAKYPKVVLDVIQKANDLWHPNQAFSLGDDYAVPSWVLKNLMVEKSLMLIAGPPSAGKSTLALNLMIRAAEGSKFLDWEFERPYRMGFFSLEMNELEIGPFIHKMKAGVEDPDSIADSLQVWPLGHAINLADVSDQQTFWNSLHHYEIEGVIIDSFAMLTPDSLQSEDIKKVLQFLVRLQNELGIFVVIIHHDRKTPTGETKKGDLDDVFGARGITAAASVVMFMKDAGGGDGSTINFPKVRMAAKPTDSTWKRDGNLWFRSINEVIIKEPAELKAAPVGQSEVKTPVNLKLDL